MNFWCYILTVLAVSGYTESQPEVESSASESVFVVRPDLYRPWMSNNTAAGLYNSSTEKCCLGSVYPNKKAAYEKCCGSRVIDSSRQLCCNDAIVPLVPGESCCGQTTIDTDSAICCGGEATEMSTESLPFARCCGKETYDKRTHTCCNSEADFRISEGTNMLCCGIDAYESNKQVCCAEYNNKSITYRLLSADGAEKTSCCGESVYDRRTETCCDKTVIQTTSGCCAGKPFDKSTHICCNQQLMETNGKRTDCCGNSRLDLDNEICCSGYSSDGNFSMTVVKKTDPNQRGCCGTTAYDNSKEVCCSKTKKVITKSKSDDNQCCGDQSFNIRSGLCCDDTLFPDVSKLTHICCEGKPLDRSTNMSCCGKKIRDKSLSCCGISDTAQSYDTATQLCCLTFDASSRLPVYTVLPNSNNNMSCCGSKAFDVNKELCCLQQIVPKKGNGQCCGGQSFDVDKEVCCSQTTIFPKENGRDACCLYGTTDEEPEFPIFYPYSTDIS